ncbi:MAG: transposase [Armatimonadota bacterium]
MKYDKDKHHRRSIRFPEYNYSAPGAYYITLCTYDRSCIFGEIIDGIMVLSEFGHAVNEIWLESFINSTEIFLDYYVIMPNRFHCVIFIATESKDQIANSDLQMDIFKRRKMLLSKFIGKFKMSTSKQINKIRGTLGNPVWQRNYYEHVIRHEDDLAHIREYIMNNPINWNSDENYQ